MPTEHIIALLIAERDKLNRAIEALQGTKRRGRPPKNSSPALKSSSEPAAKKKRTWTAAQRRAQAERVKARWAKQRKEAGSKRG